MTDRPWTKGPWKKSTVFTTTGATVNIHNGGADVAIYHLPDSARVKEAQANARLITTAPELWEALAETEHFVRGKEEELHATILAALTAAWPGYKP